VIIRENRQRRKRRFVDSVLARNFISLLPFIFFGPAWFLSKAYLDSSCLVGMGNEVLAQPDYLTLGS
jgi:hypothetical protein